MLFLNQCKKISIKDLNLKTLSQVWITFLVKSDRAFRNVFKGLIFLYQSLFSFFLGGNCRFYPSCSCYAKQAFDEHNFIYALYLVVVRLSKCRPGGPFGDDPVPKQKKELKYE